MTHYMPHTSAWQSENESVLDGVRLDTRDDVSWFMGVDDAQPSYCGRVKLAFTGAAALSAAGAIVIAALY